MKKYFLLLSTSAMLSGCFTSTQEFSALNVPNHWEGGQNETVAFVETEMLQKWWEKFDDPVLNTLIEKTLSGSPDRNIAKARIIEARGVHRSARSFLFPKIGASGNVNRQDYGYTGPDNFFDAGFDASYELDIFGRVRNTIDAEEARLQALEAEYQDVTLTLIADVARSYINYRAAQKQTAIAYKNLEIQTKTLELIKQQQELGEVQQLDVERSKTLVNTTKASIPEFERLADNYRLQLSVLVGNFPEELLSILEMPADIPSGSIKPVLLAPSDVLSLRPDILSASADLSASTSLTKTAVAALFPSFTIDGFFGYSEIASYGTESIWRIILGSAVTLIDFGRIEGAIDAARARETQSYERMRKTVLQAVTEVETALSDTAYINEQRTSLQKAFDSAERSFTLSEALYREGEISFLDVLDAQRTVNVADAALVSAEAAQAESLVRLYKSLGVY